MDLENVFSLLITATLLEKDGQRIEAATKYDEGCYLMRQILSRFPQDKRSSPVCSLLEEKIELYSMTAQNLYFCDDELRPTSICSPTTVITNSSENIRELENISVHASPSMALPKAPRPLVHMDVGKSDKFTQPEDVNRIASLANANLSRAIDLDEENQTGSAIRSYLAAAEMYLTAVQLSEKSSLPITAVMKRRLTSALDRMETLKNTDCSQQNQEQLTLNGNIKSRASSQALLSSSSHLSKEEIRILKQSSLITSGLFLPFSEEEAQFLSRQVEVQKSNKSKIPKFWKDPDGDLPLSDKQKKKFHKWARPCEIVQQRFQLGVKQHPPTMISNVSPYTIRQQYVTDCSFIASLCICALFEKRFRKGLLSTIIYPQDKNGMPVYNPSGKYIVKLWLNGVARSVIVDDRLPVDRHFNLLCSQTMGNHNQLELFCCIIEKAYMKLSGGYDFPGSNSGVDLFSLTGWIPERIFFPSKHAAGKIQDFETRPDRAWDRLYSANSFGDCLITVSTSCDITEDKAKSLGLVKGHAYAVLDVFQSKKGTKLLRLKNPWACERWTGKYSPTDNLFWRDKELRNEIGYDPVQASKEDDGIFWISWEDVLLYFRNLQLSWNPKLFSYRLTTHGLWPKTQGPKIDTFNIGENPQYIMVLSDKSVSRKPSVWILISRHVSKQEQKGDEVNDYLTIHLVRNSSKLERVWYPQGKDTIINGCYTNNAHVLLRYDISGVDDQFISLVLSQHEKIKDLSYTLSCYCTEPFTLKKPPKMLPSSLDLRAKWTSKSAGGAIGSKNFVTNPMFKITLSETTKMQIRCTTSKAFAVNILLLSIPKTDPNATSNLRELFLVNNKPSLDSGNYRHRFTITKQKLMSAGTYVLIISTFSAGQLGEFIVRIDSSVDVMANPIA